MKRNFEPSDKGLKCFIEQHGITLKINKGKTNTINSPQDPSCSLVVEAVEPEFKSLPWLVNRKDTHRFHERW